MWLPKNITKTESGAARPPKSNVTFIRAIDVAGNITRDSNGVRILGNVTPKPGAKMFSVYLTPTRQEHNYASEGEEDQEAVRQTFIGWAPGDSLELSEFIQNSLGVGYIIIADNCTSGQKRVYGTLCSPMKLNVEKTANNEGVGAVLTFEQIAPTKYLPGHYFGATDLMEPHSTDSDLNLTVANGTTYSLDGATPAGETIDVASIDLETDTYISLIGAGGTSPFVLKNGETTSTEATVILKEGTDWTAMKEAVITLRVVNDGANTYLIEESRS